MSFFAEYGSRAYGGGVPIWTVDDLPSGTLYTRSVSDSAPATDAAVGVRGPRTRNASDSALAVDSISTFVWPRNPGIGEAYQFANIGLDPQVETLGEAYQFSNIGLNPFQAGVGLSYMLVNELPYAIYFGTPSDDAPADDVGTWEIHVYSRHPMDSAVAFDSVITHAILQPTPPPPPPPPVVVPPPPPVVSGVIKRAKRRTSTIRPARTRQHQDTWSSDVRVSQPVPPDVPVLKTMGGFGFTSGGIAHNLTEVDAEEIFVPSYSPLPLRED